jgi:opacity protein-like surface antigen
MIPTASPAVPRVPKRTEIALCSALLALGAGPAAAGDSELFADLQPRLEREAIADIAQPWTAQLEPSVWFVAPGGSMRMPGEPRNSRRKRLELINLDNPRLSPFGEANLRTGEWHFNVLAFSASQSDRGTEYTRNDWIGPHFVEAGDSISASVDFASAEFSVGYRIPIPDTLVGRGGRDFRGTLEAIGGIRLYSVDFEFVTPSGTTSHDDFLAEPILGLRYTMEIRRRFNIDVQVSLGGFDDGGHRRSFSYDIMTGFSYRPVENVGIQIGYRQLAFDLMTGSDEQQFRYDGALAGLYGGLLVRF